MRVLYPVPVTLAVTGFIPGFGYLTAAIYIQTCLDEFLVIGRPSLLGDPRISRISEQGSMAGSCRLLN